MDQSFLRVFSLIQSLREWSHSSNEEMMPNYHKTLRQRGCILFLMHPLPL